MIEVIKTGMFLSIQDLGRSDYTSFGVPQSGVMDRYASKFANLIIGNKENDAVIETTSGHSVLKFHQETVLCVSGAEVVVSINDMSVKQNKALKIGQNDILKIRTPTTGFRSYIAVQGGIQTEIQFGSRSMYQPITSSSYLIKGDTIPIKTFKEKDVSKGATVRFDASYLRTNSIDAYPGPEYTELSKEQQNKLLNTSFAISANSNRMGIRLIERIPNQLKPIVTSLVLPGTVQLTPDGTLIVLMQDAQTTGGYPRILQLTDVAMNTLAQKKFGTQIQFNIISQTT